MERMDMRRREISSRGYSILRSTVGGGGLHETI